MLTVQHSWVGLKGFEGKHQAIVLVEEGQQVSGPSNCQRHSILLMQNSQNKGTPCELASQLPQFN